MMHNYHFGSFFNCLFYQLFRQTHACDYFTYLFSALNLKPIYTIVFKIFYFQIFLTKFNNFFCLYSHISLNSIRFIRYKFVQIRVLQNCFKNLKSPLLNNRISLIPYFIITSLSMPVPKAKPVYFSESIPPYFKTLG